MGFNVKLATSGIAGVTNLVAGEITVANDNETLALNSINILTDAGGVDEADFTVMLPPPPPLPSDILDGTLVEFKNLLTPRVTDIDVTPIDAVTTTGNVLFNAVAGAGALSVDNIDFVVGLTFVIDTTTYTIGAVNNVIPGQTDILFTPVLGRAVPAGEVITGLITPGSVSFLITQGIVTESVTVVPGQTNYMLTERLIPGDSALVVDNNGTALSFNLGDATTATATIDSNGSRIDGMVTNITTNTRLQIFRLVYISRIIGWAAV